jgi:Tfp pilus assembly protein PilN
MSVKVNLLPREVAARSRASRQSAMVAGAFAVLVLLIAGAWFWQNNRVNAAQAVVDDEQATLSALQSERSELASYQDLGQRLDSATQVLQQAMGGEVSFAGILQDIAAVMPPDTQLDNLTLTVAEPADPELGDLRPSLGTIGMTGKTLGGHAPGLERFLIEFDKMNAFSDLFFSNSSLDELGISTFNVQADLGPEILTGRYVGGLPEELR